MSEKKIHIKPKSQQGNPQQFRRNFGQEIDDLKKMVKNIKQQIKQLGEHEKDVEHMINKEITLEFLSGAERKGVLKHYGKYTIDIQDGDTVKTYMKHAILGYHF